MDFARRLFDLMFFRCGPQDMPGTPATIASGALVYAVLVFVQAEVVASVAQSALQAVAATGLLALYVAVVLRLRGVPSRYAQTLTALYASGVILKLLMFVPAHAMATYMQAVSKADDPQSVPMPSEVALLAYIVIGFWGVAIYSHIYRHALDGSIWLGLGAAIAFELFVLFIFSAFG